MRSRAWGWLLLVPAAMAAAVAARSPFPSFHQHLSLAGTPDRFAATVVRAGRSDARAALWVDNLFLLSWVLVVPRLMRAGLERWAPERRRMVARWRVAPRIAMLATAVGVVQNVLALTMVGKRQPATGLTLALVSVTWVMWLLFAWSLVAVSVLVVGPLVAPALRPALRGLFSTFDGRAAVHPQLEGQAAVTAAAVSADDASPSIGICVSGGGGRAASVALGALRGFDAPRSDGASLFARSRWLVAVGGGSWTAGGWRITRRPGATVQPLADERRDGAFDADHPWASTVRGRRSVAHGTLATRGAAIDVAIRSVFVLGGLASALFLLGRLVGRAVRTRSVHPTFPFTDAAMERTIGWRELVPARLVVAGLALIVVGGVLALVRSAAADGERRRRWNGPAVLAGATGAALLILLIGVPTGLVYGRRTLAELPLGSADGAAGALAGLAVLGVAGSLAALAGALGAGAANRRSRRRWSTLGTAALVVLALLFAGKVADTFAYGTDGFWRHDAWVAIALVWLVALALVPANRLTIGEARRRRLSATFAAGDGSTAPLPALDPSVEPDWAAYTGAGGPELIVPAAARSTAPAFGGRDTFGFTFRPGRFSLHDRTDGSTAQVTAADAPRGSWWDGFAPMWRVSSAMALGDTAVGSGSGSARDSRRTTDALFVALDLRLGAWVPNPRFAHWFADPATSPRVHLGYLLKELFDRYHPDRDAFVYVTDGGRRDRLGLVEALRERPDMVFCVDAACDRSTDESPSLADAIELARIELGVDIDLGIDLVIELGTERTADQVAVGVLDGTVTYPDSMGGGSGRLVYGRVAMSGAGDHDLLAASGEQVAEQMVRRYETGNSIQGCV